MFATTPITTSAIRYKPIKINIEIANLPYLSIKLIIGFKYIFSKLSFDKNFIFINNSIIKAINKKHKQILIAANKNFLNMSSELKGLSKKE